MPFVLNAIFGGAMVVACAAEHPNSEPADASMPSDSRGRAATTRHFDGPRSSS
jgi:hypothetical protein